MACGFLSLPPPHNMKNIFDVPPTLLNSQKLKNTFQNYKIQSIDGHCKIIIRLLNNLQLVIYFCASNSINCFIHGTTFDTYIVHAIERVKTKDKKMKALLISMIISSNCFASTFQCDGKEVLKGQAVIGLAKSIYKKCVKIDEIELNLEKGTLKNKKAEK